MADEKSRSFLGLGAGSIGFLLLVAAAVLAAILGPAATPRSFSTGDITRLLGGYIAIALFVERTLEVFIAAARGGETEKRVAASDTMMYVLAAAPADSALQTQASSATRQLIEYKSGTRTITLRAGLVVGVLLAAAGLRTLDTFVAPAASSPWWQGVVYRILDALITGGLIGGGSAALHQLMSTLLSYLNQNRAPDQTPRPIVVTPTAAALLPPLAPGPPVSASLSAVPRTFYLPEKPDRS